MWGTQVACDAMRMVPNEFWPDIRRKFSKIEVPVPESPDSNRTEYGQPVTRSFSDKL